MPSKRVGEPPDDILVYSAVPASLWADEQYQFVVPNQRNTFYSLAWWGLIQRSLLVCLLPAFPMVNESLPCSLSSVVITVAFHYCCIWQMKVSAAPSVHKAEGSVLIVQRLGGRWGASGTFFFPSTSGYPPTYHPPDETHTKP